MPKSKRPKPLYQRGGYALYPRAGRNHEIVWYDTERGRERSASAGTVDLAAGREALDRIYLQQTKGEAFCPTCGKPKEAGGVLVMTAIADYMTLAADKPSIGAIRPRLNHVLTFQVATGRTADRSDQVDERWISAFRAWAIAQPIVSPKGNERARSLSTVENSVLQLSAAINKCGGVRAGFAVIQPKEVNETPTFRADLPTLASMFRYCLYPTARSDVERERRKRERENLLAFLRISVATWARPDAAHDVSTAAKRKQWDSRHRILNLNPSGRRQTRKYRAIVPVARQMAPHLDACTGMLIPVESVGSAWDSMAAAVKLPGNGQAGMKLIRRSIAHLVRARLPEEAWGEVSMFLGHDKFDDTSDLYAPFSPTYLRRALAAVESLIDDLEKACPGAFYRAVTASEGKVVALGASK